MVKNLDKAVDMISSFEWNEKVSFLCVYVYFYGEYMGIKRVFCYYVSSIKEKNILDWDEIKWRTNILRSANDYKKNEYRIIDVRSVVISFQEDGWELYHLECTDLGRNDWFNRVIMPSVELIFEVNEEPYLIAFPKKEFFLRPEEQVLIHSADALKLATKLVDPNRLKETESDLPYVKKGEEDEWRLIRWPEYFE